MDDSLLMRCLQRVSNLARQFQRLLAGECILFQPLIQRLPPQEFHHDEGLVAVLPNIVEGADVGVIEGRRSPGLSTKALNGMGIIEVIERKELNSYWAAQSSVSSPIDDTHPALTDLLKDQIVRDRLSQQGRCRGRL